VKKRRAISPNFNPKRRRQVKFPPISEEMKRWSAMLESELNSWPGITTKSMFGFLFFYRRAVVFAALPRTRGFDSPSSLVFKFNPMPPALRKRAKDDPRMDASTKASSRGWFSFAMYAESDLRDALFWLNQSYEAARKGAAK